MSALTIRCEVCGADGAMELAPLAMPAVLTLRGCNECFAAMAKQIAALKEVVTEFCQDWGGPDHHKDDCPEVESGGCEDCAFARRVNVAYLVCGYPKEPHQ